MNIELNEHFDKNGGYSLSLNIIIYNDKTFLSLPQRFVHIQYIPSC